MRDFTAGDIVQSKKVNSLKYRVTRVIGKPMKMIEAYTIPDGVHVLGNADLYELYEEKIDISQPIK